MPNSTAVAVRALVALVGLCLCTALIAAESFSSLEERMTAREFRDAGLDKLSPEELAALNRWIRERSLAEGEALQLQQGAAGRAGDRRGFSDGERTTIRSRLDGTFTGWEGETEFRLQNGMVWRQDEAGSHVVPEMENPEVEIRPGTFGTWQMTVGDYNRRLKVVRIE